MEQTEVPTAPGFHSSRGLGQSHETSQQGGAQDTQCEALLTSSGYGFLYPRCQGDRLQEQLRVSGLWDKREGSCACGGGFLGAEAGDQHLEDAALSS